MADCFRSSGVPLWLSLPARPHRATPVIVAVHGISRNAREHVEWLSAAAAPDVAIVAPQFDADAFPRYQQLGLGPGERRADLWLDAALDALQRATGVETARFHLFGFSGGAQFAHRYALLSPWRVRSLHLAAAGYYTYLDDAVPWPRGLRDVPLGSQLLRNRNFFLRLPIDVYVGSEDTERDPALRRGRAIDAQQGRNRRERALAWCAHLRGQQARLRLPEARLSILPNTGHDFREACRAGQLERRALGDMGLLCSADQRNERGRAVTPDGCRKVESGLAAQDQGHGRNRVSEQAPAESRLV